MGENKECRADALACARDDYIFDWDFQIPLKLIHCFILTFFKKCVNIYKIIFSKEIPAKIYLFLFQLKSAVQVSY